MLSVLIPDNNEPHINDLIKAIEKIHLASQVIVAVDREGKGKGWALREALKEAKGDHIAFLDADMDIHPRMLKRLFPFLEDVDVVVGSKRMTNAPLHRKIVTYLSRIYIRLMFGLPWDTQTGLKLFRRSALNPWKTDGFAFDIEILTNAHKRGLRIAEVPIEAEIKEPMSWRVVWRTFIESLRIRFR